MFGSVVTWKRTESNTHDNLLFIPFQMTLFPYDFRLLINQLNPAMHTKEIQSVSSAIKTLFQNDKGKLQLM